MSEERNGIDNFFTPTRENYRRQKEQLREGKRKIDEIEKREQELFKLFTALFYGTIDEKGNVDKNNLKKVSDTFSNYTSGEMEELYPKLQYLAPWKEDRPHARWVSESINEILWFLLLYIAVDFLLMTFLSFFVWRMTGDFLYIAYSAAISVGLMGILMAAKGVMVYVRKTQIQRQNGKVIRSISVGALAALEVVKGVIKHVRKKKEK